jgi:hypothetical protein
MRLSLLAGTGLLLVLIAGCGGGSGTHAPATNGARKSVTSTRASSPSTLPHHADPYPALCRRIDPADAQRLFRVRLGLMTTGGSSDCQFAPRGSTSDLETVRVYLRIHDGDKTLYDHVGDIDYGTFRELDGLGYQAKWAAGPGTAPTVVDVRDGSFTCTVIPPSDPEVTALRTSGGAGSHVAPAQAASYALEIGALCRDIFDHR